MKKPPRPARRFQRARHLVAYWQNGSALLMNYRSRTSVPFSARMFEVLSYLGEPRAPHEIARQFSLGSTKAAQLLTALSRCGLVEGSSRRLRTTDSWSAWDPAAGFFHFATRDTEFNDALVEGEIALARKALRSPPPTAVKRAAGKRFPLVAAEPSALTELLTRRRTWRAFANRPVPQSALSTLLKYTFGVQQWARSPVHGRLALKTAPSGGACHPIEAYVAVRRVAGLAAGLYHYAPDRHGLTQVRAGLTRRDLGQWIQSQPWFAGAPVVVFFTAIYARTMWRYEMPRAYRNVLLEAGHLCQTFCVLATDLGLAPFCTHAIRDSLIDAALRLDGIDEGVVYVAGCGVPSPRGWSADVPGVSKWLV